MSLKSMPIPAVPDETARITQAAFLHGTLLVQIRDALGTLYIDDDFADLFPSHGQPAPGAVAPGAGECAAVYGRSDRSAGGRCGAQSPGLEVCACDTKLHGMSGKCYHFPRSVSWTCPHLRVRRWQRRGAKPEGTPKR